MKRIFSLVAVLAFGALLLAGCGAKPASQEVNVPTGEQGAGQSVQENSEENFSGSLNDLIKRGLPTKCAFSYAEDGVAQVGETYISGEQARVNTKMTNEGKASEVYVIKKGTDYYIWTSDTPGKGTKFSFTETEEKELQEKGQQANKNVDFDKKVDYKCDVWLPDNSLFAVPSNVEFQDMTEIFKDMIDQGGQIMQEVCDMCDSLPAGAARDNCVQANCK